MSHMLCCAPACMPRRAEIEAQEGVIEQLERRLADAERAAAQAAKRAAAAESAAAEKEGMIAYVGEEVERVKALFGQKVRCCGAVCCRCLGRGRCFSHPYVGACSVGVVHRVGSSSEASQVCCCSVCRMAPHLWLWCRRRGWPPTAAPRSRWQPSCVASEMCWPPACASWRRRSTASASSCGRSSSMAALRQARRSGTRARRRGRRRGCWKWRRSFGRWGWLAGWLTGLLGGLSYVSKGCTAADTAHPSEAFPRIPLQVLSALEQHKAASAAKFAQLQSVLQDGHAPFLH